MAFDQSAVIRAMDFSLSEEQQLLKDSVTRYLENDYDFRDRQATVQTERGFSDQHWSQFAELGWLSVPLPESCGGFGGQIEDTAVLCEAFGRELVVEPFLATVMLGGKLLAAHGDDAIVGSIIEGGHHAALAALERQSRQDFCDVTTTADKHGDGYVLNGHKELVLNGMAADTLVVTARTSGERRDKDGITLFAVPASSDGIQRHAVQLMDGTRAAQIRLSTVAVNADQVLGTVGTGAELLAPVIAEAQIAVCAESVGLIDALCEKTLEYSRTRNQFGVAIGSFQALQHRMVDMLMSKEQARSMLYRGICELQQNEASWAESIAAMKAVVGRNGRHVGEEAIQLHGGMGMTDELDIGHYVKRLMVLTHLFGDIEASMKRFAQTRYAA